MLKLNIDNIESVFDNIKCQEEINTNLLNKLINSDLLVKVWDKVDESEYIYENEKEQLEKYLKLFKGNICDVTYKFSNDMSLGRVYPHKSLSLCTIRREIRHTIARDYYVDIDIKNCHPVLLNHLCELNDIDNEKLSKYINNRDEIINNVIKEYQVTKDEAKNLFISIIYGGSFSSWCSRYKVNNDKPNKFIINFSKEIKNISKQIKEVNEKILSQIMKKKKNKNDLSVIMSYLLQDLERRILEDIYKYCIKKDYINKSINDCVLCYDGIMIKKDKYNNNILKEFSKVIKNNFKIDLEFTKKELNEGFTEEHINNNILTEEERIKKEITYYDFDFKNDDVLFSINKFDNYFYDDIKILGEELYIKYIHFTNSFKYYSKFHVCIAGEYYLLQNNNDSLIVPEPIKAYRYLRFTYKNKEYSFYNLYDLSRYKNKYCNMIFEPYIKNELVNDSSFNIFRGFSLYDENDKSYDNDVVNLFINHISYLCKEEGNIKKPITEYILNWFSHILQFPNKKTCVAVLLYSFVHGIGKNILVDIFNSLLDNYTTVLKNTDELTKNFNMRMAGKILVVGNEITNRAKEFTDVMKDMLTRSKDIIEPKGKDSYEVNDYKNYIFTTNNENTLKIELYDRRYMLIECNEEKKNKEYYEELAKILKDDNKKKSIFNYLLYRDISNIDLHPINTDYKRRLLICNLESYNKFYIDYIAKIADQDDNRFKCNDGFKLTSSDLYELSITFNKNHGKGHSYSEDFFNKNTYRIFKDYHKKINKKNCYLFPCDKQQIIRKVIDYVDSCNK